jgi:hypothetical protein
LVLAGVEPPVTRVGRALGSVLIEVNSSESD